MPWSKILLVVVVYTVILLKRLLVLIELLLKIINLVLNDRRFGLPSSSATAVHSIATMILWQKDPGHTHVFNQFAD